jgi:mono/diheme cytochrome c family protein
MFRRRAALLFIVVGPALAFGAEVPQSPAEDLFARKCASCHTVGKGVRVGPDLKDAHKRRSRSWLESFVKVPSALLDTDAEARNLLSEFKGVRMPDLGLSDTDVKALVDLVIRCSAEACNLAGKFTPATLATERDVALGRSYFLGLTPLKGGGAPCVSCHTVRGIGSIVPGGTMAKDLTNVFARLGDEGLDRALASPAFPLMNKVFTDHPVEAAEVFSLRAFLYKANLGGEPAREDSLSIGLVAGVGTIAVLVLLNALWVRRLKGVRRPLTHKREQPS